MSASTAGRLSTAPLQQLGRVLFTHNPFYLLSVACVLHSTRLWFQAKPGAYDPWPLMGIIGGYIVLVAVVGLFVVRLGKVWDDARSIFFILLLLFVELSLTFDPVLIDRPRTGTALLLVGCGVATLASEVLLIGLRIRLPLLFRLPYHLLLALLFLYPPAIVAVYRTGTETAVWRIFLFAPLSAGALLTLLPAVRRGPDYVRANGTPWAWPWFPWPLFGFLAACLGVRTYALSLSFDSVMTQGPIEAMRMESAFAPWFLVPIVLAVGVLLLEAGIVSSLRRLQQVALAVPLTCLGLALPGLAGSVPARDFLERFTNTVGSPLWLAVLASATFYGYAMARRTQFALEGLALSVCLAAVIGPRTLAFNTLTLQTTPLWIVAAMLLVWGRHSRELFFAVLVAVLAGREDLWGQWPALSRDGLSLHFVGMAMLILGAVFQDRFAARLRIAGVPVLVLAAACAALWQNGSSSLWIFWARTAYLTLLIALAFSYAYGLTSRWYFTAGVVVTLIALGRLLHDGTRTLQQTLGWEGAGSFVLGLTFLVVGAGISAIKAGLVRRLAWVVPSGEPARRE